MTTEALAGAAHPGRSLLARLFSGKAGPLTLICLVIVAVWYGAAVRMNAPFLLDQYQRQGETWTIGRLVQDAWAQERPVLPAPHQIVFEIKKTTLDKKVTSKRSLVFHAWVTLSSTLLGFLMGAVLGVALAVGIVHVKTLDLSLLAIISTYLCFFPVAIGMVKGLRSPDPLQMDLMRTYSASRTQVFWKLRWPASVPFLFTSLKVAVAISLVGAIVGELPTGAQAGIGARLLVGSYYGQTIQIWAALFVAAALAALLVALVGLSERLVLRHQGARP
jgi:NitT/TauT family transport system permease protein